jgi:glycosyltransferase involved in cell wall biosynthesis
MTQRWHIHLAGWLPIAWALDEDLRQTKMALAGDADWSSFSSAKIIHAAWPAAISALPEAALRGKLIICQADNPPSFYLGTREFCVAAERTHHWVARSSEARSQFELLGLPVIQAPYTVDRNIFRPLPERSGIRRSLGLSDNAFVIGNFHRDSEGENLRKPKLQKGPDIFLQIARRVRAELALVAIAGLEPAQPAGLVRGTLFVNVDSSTWLSEIVRYRRHEILERLQLAVGKAMVQKISFRVG